MRHAALAALALLLAAATSAAAQETFPPFSQIDASTIAGRPVQLDSAGKLLPWPDSDNTGDSYASYFLSQWRIVWDQYNGQRLPYFYCCFDFDRTTLVMVPDKHWANSTGYLRAMMEGFVERLYPYTGDPDTLTFLRNFVDYELQHGTTPHSYAWAGVPYPSADPGAAEYRGWSEHGKDFIEPHVVGEDGYAYLRLYEITGEKKYLRAAIRCANALLKNYRPGDAQRSPWPFRCSAKDGSLEGGKGFFPYSANVLGPITLLDELIRIRRGHLAAYRRLRADAWQWLMRYPMQNDVWVGYF